MGVKNVTDGPTDGQGVSRSRITGMAMVGVGIEGFKGLKQQQGKRTRATMSWRRVPAILYVPAMSQLCPSYVPAILYADYTFFRGGRCISLLN